MTNSFSDKAQGPASGIPTGWNKNPSAWSERLIAIALAVIGLGISTYLALYQLGIVENVWEPFFGDGSYRVLHSSLSRLFPVPDAALGAFGYALEVGAGAIGGSQRWRTLPWIAALFGIISIGMAGISLILIVCQPLIAHGWCTLCLCSAFISFMIVALVLNETRLTLEYLRTQKGGQFFARLFRGKALKI